MFTILRSSAGAGKTHALVKHYLTHALRTDDPSLCRRVLALTFTNKAAGEMKERVMRQLRDLAAGAEDDGAVNDIREHLTRELRIDGEELQRRASAAITWMLHHWGEVAITTIDAFTRRLVRPFARDLQLDGELRMTTEQAWYRDRAVDHLLEDAGRDEQLTHLLARACSQLLEDERGWQPRKPLADLAMELDREQALEHLARLRDLPVEHFLDVEAGLRSSVHAFRERMRAWGREGLEAIGSAGLGASDLYRAASGPYGYIKRLADFDGALDPPNSYVRTCLDEDRWTASKDADVRARVERVAPTLRRIIEHVEGLRSTDLRRHVVQRAVLRDLMATATLHLLDERLGSLKREDGVSFFSDLTRKVAGVLRDEPADFLFERIGEKYRHILIDEFQDTSLLQWHALLPLVENALANGGSTLVVGDAKQAIYRWRNGEVRQFAALPGIHGKERLANAALLEGRLRASAVVPGPLNTNRRSAPAIIRFNNEVFERLKSGLPDGARVHFQAHGQLGRQGDEGSVRIEVIGGDEPATDGAEGGEAADVKEEARRALRVARECLDDGYAPGDIAVLVRSHDQVRQIAACFEADGLDVFSMEGLLLGNDPLVAVVIDLLEHQHTGGVDAGVRAVQRMASLGLVRNNDAILLDPPGVLHAWNAAHPRLRPFEPLTDQLRAIMAALGRSPAEDAYLLFLLDEAHAFSTRGGGDVPAFLDHWHRKGRERAVQRPAGDHAVQVLTVHKAKGLEFPVVIVPFTRMGGGRRNGAPVWIDPGEAVPDLPVALVRNTKAIVEAGVPEALEEKEMQRLDDLDLLYVAFTRPKERLYVFSREKSTDPFEQGLVDLVAAGGEGGIFQRGARRKVFRSTAAPTEVMPPVQGNGQYRPAIRFEAPEQWVPDDPDPYRRRGDRIHALMAQLATADDLPLAVEKAVQRGDLSQQEAITTGERLGELLRSPAVAPFFRKGSTHFAEVTLIDAGGRSLRPDRIVEQDGAWRVLDIKTGRPHEAHHDQVRGYMRVLAEVTGAPVTGSLLYLRTGEVVNIP